MLRIDDVIRQLDEIIAFSEEKGDTAGYFAALYRRVTVKVKEGIEAGRFDDGPRMEQLDVLFAQRYIDAWKAWQAGSEPTASWKLAFEYGSKWPPIVLQHLLVGMNAHINLDLGIAAAECMRGKQLADLQADFNRINLILSELVHEVQDNLSAVWPALKWILKLTGKIDDYLVDFSMKLARDGAWKFAGLYFETDDADKLACLQKRDQRIAEIAAVVTRPVLVAVLVLLVVRLTERGSIGVKIGKLARSSK